MNKIFFALTIACVTNLSATKSFLENKFENLNLTPAQDQEIKQEQADKKIFGEKELVRILNSLKKDPELKKTTINSLKNALKENYGQLKELAKENQAALKDKETVNKILKELVSNNNNSNKDKYSYKKLFFGISKNTLTTKYGLICVTIMVALAQIKGIITSQTTLEIFKEIRYSLRWLTWGKFADIAKNICEGILFAIKAKFTAGA